MLPLILLGLFLLTAVALLYGTGFVQNIDLMVWRDWVLSLGWLGPIVYMLAYTLRPFVLFPAAPLTLFGGYTFGAFWGTLYDVIGAGTGALLAFLLTRYVGRESVEKLIKGKKIHRFDDQVEQNGFLVIFYARLLPLIPFDAVNYGAGLSKVKVRHYALGTYLGIIPGAFVYNMLGQSFRDVGSGQFYLAVGMYLVFATLPLVAKPKRS